LTGFAPLFLFPSFFLSLWLLGEEKVKEVVGKEKEEDVEKVSFGFPFLVCCTTDKEK
jgi:hypothetical protein